MPDDPRLRLVRALRWKILEGSWPHSQHLAQARARKEAGYRHNRAGFHETMKSFDRLFNELRFDPINPDDFYVAVCGTEYRGREGLERFRRKYPQPAKVGLPGEVHDHAPWDTDWELEPPGPEG